MQVAAEVADARLARHRRLDAIADDERAHVELRAVDEALQYKARRATKQRLEALELGRRPPSTPRRAIHRPA